MANQSNVAVIAEIQEELTTYNVALNNLTVFAQEHDNVELGGKLKELKLGEPNILWELLVNDNLSIENMAHAIVNFG